MGTHAPRMPVYLVMLWKVLLEELLNSDPIQQIQLWLFVRAVYRWHSFIKGRKAAFLAPALPTVIGTDHKRQDQKDVLKRLPIGEG